MTYDFTPETRQDVAILATGGVPHTRIAQYLGISSTTLRAHFAQELDNAKTEKNKAVIQTAYRLATSGKCPVMTIFWLKCRLNWSEIKGDLYFDQQYIAEREASMRRTQEIEAQNREQHHKLLERIKSTPLDPLENQ